jgi:hypothetical protein
VAVLGLVRLFQLVGPVALVAVQALDERIGEHIEVPGRPPHLGREDHGRVDPHNVVAGLHHRLPPLAADVLLQFDAERTVVPRRSRAAVDLAGREDETASLAQVDDGVVSGSGRDGGHGVSCIDSGGTSRVSGAERRYRHRSMQLATT